MKEKLIQILDLAPHGAVGVGPTSEELAEHILSRLRCDRCKHYKVKPHGSTECLHPENRWPDDDSYGEEYLMPKPADFCANWEPKQ